MAGRVQGGLPLLVLNFCLDIVDGIGRLDLEGDGLACEGLDEDLHGCVREKRMELYSGHGVTEVMMSLVDVTRNSFNCGLSPAKVRLSFLSLSKP
jgi:hypothetical protein